MSMKPIEPGCLCLSIDSENYGQCTARYFVPAGSTFKIYGSQKIGQTISDGWSCDFPGLPAPCMVATRHLIRIDGSEEESLTTDQEQEVTA